MRTRKYWSRARLCLGLVVVSLAAVGGCRSGPAPDRSNDAPETRKELGAIGRLRQGFINAVNSHTLDGWLASSVSDGIVMMPPDQPTIVTREDVRGWLKAFLEQHAVEDLSLTSSTDLAGGWAFERGVYMVKFGRKDAGSPSLQRGKYVVIWQRPSDGSWKAAYVIWNRDGASVKDR